jgi:copper homeostasis protein
MSAHRLKLEIAVDNVPDAIAAQQAGADRLELVGELHTHGVTPPAELVRAVVGACSIPVVAMVRPREGDFCMTDAEVLEMQKQAERAVDAGAHAIVFGILTQTGHIARSACKEFLKACGGLPTVFHRAFDFAPDALEAADELVALGVTRILTAGIGTWATPTLGDVLEARCRRIADLRAHVGGDAPRIEIMPGGGVRPVNAVRFVELTGCREIHSACRMAPAGTPCATAPGLDAGMVRQLRADLDAWAAAR